MLIIKILSSALNKRHNQQQAKTLGYQSKHCHRFSKTQLVVCTAHSPVMLMRVCNRRSSQGHLTPGHLCSQCFLSIFVLSPQIRGGTSLLLGQLAGIVCAAKLCTFSVTSRHCVMAILNDKELCFLPLSICVFVLFKTPTRGNFCLKLFSRRLSEDSDAA